MQPSFAFIRDFFNNENNWIMTHKNKGNNTGRGAGVIHRHKNKNKNKNKLLTNNKILRLQQSFNQHFVNMTGS